MTELAGWREALTERGVALTILLRALLVTGLAVLGLLGADRPVLTLASVAAGAVLWGLISLRVLGRP